MRLYSGKITSIATEVVRALTASGDIEATSPKEVTADVESVLQQYLSTEREVTARAKDILEQTGKPQSEFSRVRELAAKEKGIRIGDEMLDYLLDQIVEMFNYSNNVDEIYSEDVELRRKMAPVFKKHLDVDDDLEAEIRGHLKHLSEGPPEWEIEYARVSEQAKRKKGLA